MLESVLPGQGGALHAQGTNEHCAVQILLRLNLEIFRTGHQRQGYERLHRARGQNSVIDMQHVKWAGQQQEIDENSKDAHDEKEMQ